MTSSAARPDPARGPDPASAGSARESMGHRLVRGAIGGIVAGIPFAVVTMWFAASTGGGWLAPLNLISTIVLGADALQSGAAQPWVGAVVHMAISAALGIVFALLSPALRTDAAVAVAGTAYGVVIYVVNFVIIANTLLPQFAMTNQPFELVMHTVFGTLLSFFFLGSGVRRREPLVTGR